MVKGWHRLKALLVCLTFAWSWAGPVRAAQNTTTVRLPTVCASAKTVPPPPAEGGNYRLGAYPDAKLYKKIVGILEAAKRPEFQRQFADVTIAPERRQATISQLATWMEIGKQTRVPADQITRDGIKADLLRAAKVSSDSFSRQQVKSLDQGVNAIFMAADLTRKEGLSTAANLKPRHQTKSGHSTDRTNAPAPTERTSTTGEGTSWPNEQGSDAGGRSGTAEGTGSPDVTSGSAGGTPAGSAIPGDNAATLPVVTLEDAVKNGDVSFSLVGDGVSTSHVDLVLVNKSGDPLRVLIPAYTTFLPESPGFQTMVSTTDEIADVPGEQEIASKPPAVPEVPALPEPPAPPEPPGPITQTKERPPGAGTTPRPASETTPEAPSGPSPPEAVPAMKPPCPCIVTLYWLPVTAVPIKIAKAFGLVGGIPILAAFRDVYHAALRIQIPEGDDCKEYVIELTKYVDPEDNPTEAQRVGQLMVQKAAYDLIYAGGIRLYPGGEITDESTVFTHGKVNCDCAAAHRIKEIMEQRQVPAYSYGDVVGINEDRWTSNALVSYLLHTVGCDVPPLLVPPEGGAPGWIAGLEAALTRRATGKFPGGVRMLTPPFAEGIPGMSYDPQTHAETSPWSGSVPSFQGSIWAAF